MFRNFIIIGITILLAGAAMAAKYIGNPSSSNGWSTTSKVTCTTAGQIGDPYIFKFWTYGEPCDLINGKGLDPTGQKHATDDWAGKSEDDTANWDCSYVLTNNHKDAGGNYTFIAPPYDSNMTIVPYLWFAFEFDKTYYIGDMLVWNFSEVPTTVPPPPFASPPIYREMYYSSKIVVSYTTDSIHWNEKTDYTLTPGNRMSWTRGDDQQYPDKVPIEGYANKVVINNLKRSVAPITVRAGLGEVHFEYDPNRATTPLPINSGTRYLGMTLTWTAGKSTQIAKHRIYLSTDKTAVDGRTAISLIQTATSYSPEGLVTDKIYYWAVDELKADNTVVEEGSGKTWSFKQSDTALVDDFESYTDDFGSKPIADVWLDGYVPSGNKPNGAFAELAYIDYGYKVMKLNYDNDGYWDYPVKTPPGPIDHNYSQATAKTADLIMGRNWTIGGASDIWLSFMGDTSNDANEPLYIKLVDGSGKSGTYQYNGTKSLKNDGTWHVWQIPLSCLNSIDLTDVNSVTIGIGPGGTEGVYYFDDLKLYPPKYAGNFQSFSDIANEWLSSDCNNSSDYNNDCIANFIDFTILNEHWRQSVHAPGLPVIKGPDDYNSIGAAASATLKVRVTDPENDLMSVTFYGREVNTANDFRIVIYGDTQWWGWVPAMYSNTGDVVVSLHPAAALHMGDIVNDDDQPDKEWQWQETNTTFSKLENPAATGLADGIPYLLSVGNHDQSIHGDCTSPTVMFNTYFPVSRFNSRNYWGGAYAGDTDNRWIKFSGGGMDFMAVSLEVNTMGCLQDRLDWANNLFQSNSGRRGIVVTHSLLTANGSFTAPTGGDGQKTYNNLAGNNNVFMMLCGHAPGDYYRNDPCNGHDVHLMLFDYQDHTQYDQYGGWLRVLEFSQSTNQIHVRTVRTWLKDDPDPNIGHPVQMWDVNSNNRFTINYDMGGSPAGFTVIGAVNNITSGSDATITWPNLQTGKTYEWYAVVKDWSLRTTSHIWRFTTTAP